MSRTSLLEPRGITSCGSGVAQWEGREGEEGEGNDEMVDANVANVADDNDDTEDEVVVESSKVKKMKK